MQPDNLTGNYSTEDIKLLIELLDDENILVREDATYRLTSIGKPAVTFLIEALYSSSSNVRYYAAAALDSIKDVRAAEHLYHLLLDEDSEIRNEAAYALANIDGLDRKVYLEALNSDDERLQIAAANIFRNLKDKQAIEPLIKLIGNQTYLVKWSAIYALGELEATRALPHIIAALKDKNEFVRSTAVEALGKIGDKESVVYIVAALSDADEDVRRSAAIALGRLKDPATVADLLNALIVEEDKYSRASIVETLGLIGDPRAVEPLIKVLENDCDLVKRRAANALCQIGAKTALPALQRILKHIKDYFK